MTRRLLPEWTPQWGVLLAWPHADTDWASLLDQAESTYVQLARAILAREHLRVLCRDHAHGEHIRTRLQQAGAALERLQLVPVPYNDTWARDFGPIAIQESGRTMLLDYVFNGWGGKFEAEDDDAVTGRLSWRVPVCRSDLVLEGGSIDTDGQGTLLTTSACLLNPNRNPHLDRPGIEARLREELGVSRIWWLEHGALEGDDTDAHVDTLARFCDARTLAYVQCQDPQDSHYPSLQAMEAELQALARDHDLTLVPLPMMPARHDAEGQRLPGTYANFLIINGAVLVPTYGCDTDAPALAALQRTFPAHEVIGIDCLPLIHQHGSLHCVTMQLPVGVV